MADVGYLAIVAAGFGAYWWRHLRLARSRAAFSGAMATDAEVALHVAMHEATSRGQALSSHHVLYGLLQDETVAAAIATAGGSADALEDRVLAAMAAPTAPEIGAHGEPITWRIEQVAALAESRGRRATCVDLFYALAETRAAALCDDAGLDRAAVMYALVHGGRPPEVAVDARDVLIVLRNDDYTTQQFVHRALREVFGLPGDQAMDLMWKTHREGRAVVGRFGATDARDKIAAVRALARAQAYPLWIATEPA